MVTKVLLADDHPILRQGLRTLLGQIPEFHTVGEVGDGLEAVRLAERLKPDVLIADVMMPGLSGLEVARRVTRSSTRIRVIILSMYDNEAYVLEALRNGASGYVLKDSKPADLVAAIREVAAGGRYLSPPLSQRALDAYAEKVGVRALDLYDTLTDREREVLPLAAEGLSSGEIATRLFISPRTAEAHRAHLFQKLGLRSQTELVRYAVRRGLLPLD